MPRRPVGRSGDPSINGVLSGKPSTTKAQPDDADTARELTSLVNDIGSEFKQRNDLYAYIDRILFRQIPVEIPAAYRKTSIEVHNPLAQHIANTVTAALSKNPPSCQFQPIGFGQSYQVNATEREHFFDASWARQEEESKSRLFRKFMYSLVTKGEAILKTVERTKTAWSDYAKFQKVLKGELDTESPEGPYQQLDQSGKDAVFNAKTEEYKRAQAYPIRTTFVSPSTFSYIKGEDGFTVCCEVKDVSYVEGLERFNYSLDPNGKVVPQAMGVPQTNWGAVMGKNKSLTFVEVWTWDTVFYLLIGPGQAGSWSGLSNAGGLGVGTIVKRIKHGYGDRVTKTLRGPYFQALGTTTDSSLPERAGLSILYGYLDLFPLLDSLLTIRSNAAFMTGFPAYKRTQAPGATLPPATYGRSGDEVSAATTQIVPGTIYPYDIEALQHPASGPEFTQFIQELRLMMETALPSAAQGNVGPDQSGYAVNQAAYSATLAWDPLISNAAIALGERTSFESWMIENRIGEKVYVFGTVPPDQKQGGSKDGWLGVGPDELKGVHRYKVVLNPTTPSNKVIEIRTHSEMLKLELESRDDAITDLGGNPEEVERAWLLYRLKQDPAIQAALRQRVFTELNVIDQRELGAAAANGGTPGPLSPQSSMVMASQAGVEAPGMPNVYQPGQNGVPLTPTPAGAVAGAPGGVQGPPANELPSPAGQQG